MKQATERDLQFERWLRMRNKGEIVWETKDGQQIPVKDMTDQHLNNALNMIAKQKAQKELEDLREWEYYEALGSCDDDDFFD